MRSLAFGANTIKNLLFFVAFLLFGFSGFGQVLNIEDVAVTEGGDLLFTVTFDNAVATEAFTVTTGYTDITATGGGLPLAFPVDYDNTPQMLNFLGDVGETQQFTVTTFDDAVAEATETFTVLLISSDLSVDASDTATGTITDNDTAGITVSPISGNTTEGGGTATFTVVLTSEPTADVTIPLSSSNTGEGVVSDDSVIFTPDNWDVPQTITVTGVDDAVVDGDVDYTILTGDPTSADPVYDSLTAADIADVAVTNEDDDTVGITVSPISGNTTEGGGEASFTIVLNSEPTADVTIPLASSDLTEGTLSITGVTFDSSNWSMPQEITVTGVDDSVVDGDVAYTIITGDPTSSDPFYDSLTATDVSDVAVTNEDNDTVGITVSLISGNTTEDGGEATFTIVLNSEPTADVTIPLESSDPTEGTLSITGVTFDSSNWSMPLEITVTGVDDSVVDGDVAYTIITGDVISADPNYGIILGSAIADVAVTNEDNDVAGVSINDVTVNEDAGTATFTVTFIGTTLFSFTIDYSTLDGTANAGTDYTPTSGSLTFPAGTGARTQNISVTILPNTTVEPDREFSVVLSRNLSSLLVNLEKATGVATIIDDDDYTATITATTPTASEASLVPGVFTVSLDAVNTTGNPIVVNYIVDGDATLGLDYTLAPSAGTVSIANEESSATITVTPINDNEVEEDETVILTLATGSGYDIGTPDNATISIISEDRANISIDDVTVNEGEGMATFIVTLNRDTPTDFTVSYITINGTALAGSDYIANNGSLDFEGNDGESYPIEIEILDDGLPESNETFFVELTVSNGFVELLEERVIGTIVDNDNCVAQPIRDPNVPIVFCEENFSQDLNAYVAASDIPAGYQLIWSYEDDFTVTEARLTNTVVTGAATYFGFLYNDQTNCTSTPLAVTLTQNDPPSIISTTPATICGPGTATLSATGSVSGGALYWYASPTSNDRLWVGPNFTTPNNTVTTIYYVETLANGCTSARIPVTVTVSDPIEIGTTVNDTACNEVGGNTTIDLDSTRIGNDLATGVWSIVGPQPGTVTIGPDNIVDFEGAAEGQYIFRFTTNTAVAPCVDESVEVTISVSDCTVDIIDLGLEKTVDKTNVLEGEEVVFTLTLTNLGQTTFTNVIVDELIDPDLGFQYVSHSASKGAYDVDEGLWELEEVLGDEVITLSITASVVGQGTFQNVATLMDSLPEDQNPANNTDSASVTVGSGPIADLGLEKAVDKDNVLEGDQVVFTVTLTNLGPMPVTNISVNELIDPNIGFQYVSHTASNGNYDVVRGVWELEEVLAEAINTLTITAMVVRQGTFQNVVSLANSFPADENPANNTARVSVTVGPRSNDECGFLFNQISPNGDGINDALYINCIDQFPNNSIQIFDRYGNEVFVARRYDNSWMGTGKNGDLPKGTYFYILDLGDGTEVKKGWIQIIR